MSQKERILRRLSKDKLLQLANEALGAQVSDETPRSTLIRMARESLSIAEINREIKRIRAQSRQRWRQRWSSTLVLIAMITVIGVSLVPINSVVSTALLTTPEVQWSRTYGSITSSVTVHGNYVQQTSDGGYIVAGYNSDEVNSRSLWIVKVDQDGEMQWNRTYQGYEAICIRRTTDGGYIIAGASLIGGAPKGLLVKIDSQGNLQWNKIYGGEFGTSILYFVYDVKETSHGGYIVAGGTYQALLLRIDSKGTMLWSMSYGYINTVNSVEETPDGGYVFAGSELVPYFGTRTSCTCIVRTDQYGNVLWNKTYKMWNKAQKMESLSSAYCLESTSDGGYIIGGEVYFEQSPEAFLIKTDSNGNVLWKMIYRGDDPAGARSVHQTNDGGYVIAGYRGSALWVLKVDQNGRELWSQSLNGSGFASGRCVQLTYDGGFIVAGTTSNFGNYFNSAMLIIKLRQSEPTIPMLVYVVGVGDSVLCVVSVALVGRIRKASRTRDHLPSSHVSVQ